MRRQPHQLLTHDLKEHIGGVYDFSRLAFDNDREGFVHFTLGGCVHNEDLLSDGLPRALYLSNLLRSDRSFGVDNKRNQLGVGHHLAQQLKALRWQLGNEYGDAGGIAIRPIEAFNEAEFDRVGSNPEDDGNVVVAAFAASPQAVSVATSTATSRRTRSAASAGSRLS